MPITLKPSLDTETYKKAQQILRNNLDNLRKSAEYAYQQAAQHSVEYTKRKTDKYHKSSNMFESMKDEEVLLSYKAYMSEHLTITRLTEIFSKDMDN